MTSPNYRRTLTTYLGPLRRTVALLAFVLLASIGLQLTIPLILRGFIDSATEGATVGSLVVAGFSYLGAGVVNQFLSAGATYLGAQVGWTATNRLREDLVWHLLGLDMGFHTNTTPGEIIERVDGDVTAVSNFLSRFIVRLLGAGLLLLGVLVVAWFQNVWMGVTLTAYAIVVLVVIVSMRSMAVVASEAEREASAQLFGFIEERLAGLDDIRANGAGVFTARRFVGVMRHYFFRTQTAWRKRTVFWVTSNTAFWLGDAIALAVGVWLVTRGSVTIGTAYLLVQYMQLIRTPVEQVAQEFQELQRAAGGILRIDALRAITSQVDESGSAELPAGPLSVEFDHVDFGYEESQVLFDVTFRLDPGTVLGLLGRTGGGKTTVTRLIARLYDPTSGSVRLGSVDARLADPASLRSAVGVVTQDVQLFEATVRDNLTFFRHGRSDDDILAVLDHAGLGDWIRSIGLDSMLQSGGSGLSAGESQLLAFARVFLQDPGVVILDEPSSRLDPATELLVATATERLFSGRTAVIIAHRLETVRTADEIMVIDDGRIVEYGRRETLAADAASRYAVLLARGDLDALSSGAST